MLPRETRDIDLCGRLPAGAVDRLLARYEGIRSCPGVVTPEDLLVHKVVKLRSDRRRLLQDLADIRAILDARGAALDWAYLDRWLPPVEADFLRSVLQLDDETLVRRLLGR